MSNPWSLKYNLRTLAKINRDTDKDQQVSEDNTGTNRVSEMLENMYRGIASFRQEFSYWLLDGFASSNIDRHMISQHDVLNCRQG